MKTPAHSRRTFLKSSGTLLGGSWLSCNLPLVLAVAQTACSRREAGVSWANMDEATALGLAAVAEQIFPGGDSPGATDVGVIYFIDAALGTFMAGAAPLLQEGLASLDRAAAAAHGAGSAFTGLPFEQQTELLAALERTPFFQTLLFLTQAGLFAMSKYGGNRENAGWRLIGFDHRHAWQPPFGHYDEHFAEPGEESEQS